MAKTIVMPQVGQDIETGVIVEWKVKEGDQVNKGEIIAVVESDKATFDLEAYDSGVILKILHEADSEVKVLEPIAYMGQPGEKIEDLDKAVTPTTETIPSQKTKSKRGVERMPKSKISASPSAKKLAKEHGIDLSRITGSGPKGRIVKEDVLTAISEKEKGTT